MPPHHQHPAGQPWIVAFLEFCFDIVNCRAQRSRQTQCFVQAEFDLGLCQCPELSQVILETVMRDTDFFRDVVDATGSHKGPELLKIAVDRSRQLSMAFRIRLVPPQLKIFFRPTRLQHFHRELLVEIGDRAGIARNGARCILRPTADLVDRAERKKPDQTDNPDGHDLVGQAQMKLLAHRETPIT